MVAKSTNACVRAGGPRSRPPDGRPRPINLQRSIVCQTSVEHSTFGNLPGALPERRRGGCDSRNRDGKKQVCRDPNLGADRGWARRNSQRDLRLTQQNYQALRQVKYATGLFAAGHGGRRLGRRHPEPVALGRDTYCEPGRLNRPARGSLPTVHWSLNIPPHPDNRTNRRFVRFVR